MYIMLNRKYVHSVLCFVTFLVQFVAFGPNAVTYVESRDVVLSGSGTKNLRSMSEQEMNEAASIHNTLRRRECASDMEYMKWNSSLTSMAQEWADGCNFERGQPPRNASILPYEEIGQNLHATTGFFNVTRAVMDWYREKRFYDYDGHSCKPGKQCEHYKQVVWASSREIGCACNLCANLNSASIAFGSYYYLVCYYIYGPNGNYTKMKPYQKGKACSRCGSKANWCNEGLCNRDCRKSGPGCAKCADADRKCNNVWPPHLCNHANYSATIRRSCPLMCKLCRVANGTAPLTCASPSLLHSYQVQSLPFIISTMTLATMTSLALWTIDFLR